MSEAGGTDTEDGHVIVRTRTKSRHSSGDSLKDRRRHSQTLSKLIMPDCEESVFSSTSRGKHNTHESVKEETKDLFEHFVYDEIQREHLVIPADIAATSTISTPVGYLNPTWAKYGRELRLMADEFAQSEERRKIKRRSQEVDMNAVTSDRFTDMCSELFCPVGGNSDGFTRERLMVLFFFCSDMAIRSLKEKAVNLFKKFLDWSIRFITEKVSELVERYGGWAAVLGTSGQMVTKVLIAGACVLFTVFIARFLFRRLSANS